MKSILLVLTAVFAARAEDSPQALGESEAVEGEVLVKLRHQPGAAFEQAMRANDIVSVRSVGGGGWMLLRSSAAFKTVLLAKLASTDLFAAVEPNYLVHANLIPDDPRWSDLYAMVKISAP